MDVKDIRQIAVLGAGTMGSGLASIFASRGYAVSLYSIPDPTLDRAPSVIRASLEALAQDGNISESPDDIMRRITFTTSLEQAVSGSQWLLETVVEKPDVKKAVYEQLDALCPADALITSNTSFLNIFTLMPERRLPYTAITHFFAPPQVIPLVEIVREEKTTDAAVAALRGALEAMGRVVVVMNRYVPGFCVNRLLRAISNEACYQIDQGYISPEDLDTAAKASIIPRAMVLGILQRYDFTGMDLSMLNNKNNTYVGVPGDYQAECIADSVAQGNLGVKSGKGFYDYSGRKMEDVLKARDSALLHVLKCCGDLIRKHI